MPERPFTSSDIDHFRERGYVVLREAFPRNAALQMQDFIWDRLSENVGIDRVDRATWRNATWRLNKTGDHRVYDRIGSPRMQGAFDQLIGEDVWRLPPKWGGFLVTFPQPDPEPWTVTPHQWHWDGNPTRSLTGGRRGLFILHMLSDVRPQGGGTLIATGTHTLVRRFFETVPEERRNRQKPLKRQFQQAHDYFARLSDPEDDPSTRVDRFMNVETDIEGVSVRIVEATGEPGDAYLCHPDICHTRSYNRLDVPRFMRVGGPRLNDD